MRDCSDFPCRHYEACRLYCQTAAAARGRNVPHPSALGLAEASEAPAALAVAERTPQFRLHALGRFRVFVGNREVSDADWTRARGPTDKMKALLALLAHEGPHGIRRDRLLDMLWTEQTDLDRAGASLHFALNRLRRVLEPDRPRGTKSAVIEYDGQRYRFRPHETCWLDVEAFEEHVRHAAAAAKAGERGVAAERWSLALSRYEGDFLDGLRAAYSEDAIYEWLLPRREELRSQYLFVLVALAEHHASEGDAEAGLRLAGEAIHADPSCDAAHRVVVRCLLAQGQESAALLQERLRTANAAGSERRPSMADVRAGRVDIQAPPEACGAASPPDDRQSRV